MPPEKIKIMEENKMAKLTTAEFIEAIKELSVLELNDLVKACEEEFGVSCLLYTSPSPRDGLLSRMPSSA